MSGRKKKAGSQAGRERTSPQREKVKRRRMTKLAFTLSTVIVVAAAAWIALGSRGEKSWSPSSASELLQSAATAPDDAETGARAGGAPKIVFSETSYDFGTLTQGADVSHAFVVRNAGDAPLKLLDVGGS